MKDTPTPQTWPASRATDAAGILRTWREAPAGAKSLILGTFINRFGGLSPGFCRPLPDTPWIHQRSGGHRRRALWRGRHPGRADRRLAVGPDRPADDHRHDDGGDRRRHRRDPLRDQLRCVTRPDRRGGRGVPGVPAGVQLHPEHSDPARTADHDLLDVPARDQCGDHCRPAGGRPHHRRLVEPALLRGGGHDLGVRGHRVLRAARHRS